MPDLPIECAAVTLEISVLDGHAALPHRKGTGSDAGAVDTALRFDRDVHAAEGTFVVHPLAES